MPTPGDAVSNTSLRGCRGAGPWVQRHRRRPRRRYRSVWGLGGADPRPLPTKPAFGGPGAPAPGDPVSNESPRGFGGADHRVQRLRRRLARRHGSAWGLGGADPRPFPTKPVLGGLGAPATRCSDTDAGSPGGTGPIGGPGVPTPGDAVSNTSLRGHRGAGPWVQRIHRRPARRYGSDWGLGGADPRPLPTKPALGGLGAPAPRDNVSEGRLRGFGGAGHRLAAAPLRRSGHWPRS